MDMPHMARFMTMNQVVEAKPDRQQRFEGLLAGYLVETFYPKIAKGASASVAVTSSSQNRTSDGTAIDSVIRKSGSPPEAITWRLRPQGSSYKIVDVVSDGISLATTYRDVFGAVMLVGGFQRLEQMLAARQ
jgi:phospholipid transport system substrate-binding protein